ncbi:hypothetical protein [Aquimarina algiphila]|uniref:Transglutaminase domain-containing protein n=1 Tax=Aquimarina algiphila TaxID=2047982 RepID=A0A554VAM4_9FLAO|nr:hypothetical protein [Aquimarina algiphila]TSE03242.1 hypothetical protein FOF46_29765 [Aquimarina algiphila]
MQAQTKRHINSGVQYTTFFPKSIQNDTVIVGAGKARLQDTLQLMQKVIAETLDDTVVLAKKLNAKNRYEVCRNIWNFVYGHIQYTMDTTGIEQVRRPSRTWADRTTGVDCDCYTVFIGSILTNLGIPYQMRITKYGGKKHFQHIYPIVPFKGGHITIDCVADRFNYEVPYSEKKDIDPKGNILVEEISGLSGVDIAAISLDALQQPKLPLRTMVQPAQTPGCTVRATVPNTSKKSTIPGKIVSPFRFDDMYTHSNMKKKDDFDLLNFLIISGISVAAGIGVLRLFTKKTKASRKRNQQLNAKQ